MNQSDIYHETMEHPLFCERYNQASYPHECTISVSEMEAKQFEENNSHRWAANTNTNNMSKELLKQMELDEFKRNRLIESGYPERYKPKPKVQAKETDATLSAFKRKYVRERGGLCNTYKAGGTFRKGKEEVIQKGGFFNITLQKSKSRHTKSNATTGHSDDTIVLISKSGRLIVWFSENKLPGDSQSLEQKDFEVTVKEFGVKCETGLVCYSICSSREDFIEQYNNLCHTYDLKSK